jgi:hypothetical protein
MSWKAQINDRGVITRYKDDVTGQVISAKEFERQSQMQPAPAAYPSHPSMQSGMPLYAAPASAYGGGAAPGGYAQHSASLPPIQSGGQDLSQHLINQGIQQAPQAMPAVQPMGMPAGGPNPLVQPGAQMLNGQNLTPGAAPGSILNNPSQAMSPTAGLPLQGKNLRMEGIAPGMHANPTPQVHVPRKTHGFLDATSIAILLPTLVLLALIIAAAHKKRLFPWQTIRTFNPPSGLMTPRDYERSFVCPPNLRKHGRMGKKNPNASWGDVDGVVIPFGFLARTHLPITIPMGRLPNKNMFIVAPSGSGKTTLMRSIIQYCLKHSTLASTRFTSIHWTMIRCTGIRSISIRSCLRPQLFKTLTPCHQKNSTGQNVTTATSMVWLNSFTGVLCKSRRKTKTAHHLNSLNCRAIRVV